jgi:hypothetical protein
MKRENESFKFLLVFLFVLLVLFFYPIMSVTNLLVRSNERQKKNITKNRLRIDHRARKFAVVFFFPLN